jgi:predicted dehydrogenase
MIGIAVVGYGYWGPNLARNVARQERARIVALADPDRERRAAAARAHPGARIAADASEAIAATDVDAVVIATPPATHRALALAALAAGKHVLIEKPPADTLAAARDIARAAEAAGRILMVDQTFVHAPAVETLAAIIRDGVLGDIVYTESTRTNLASFDPKIGVVRDLALHDLAIFDRLFGVAPALIAARGAPALGDNGRELAFLALDYAGINAHLHVNCISPVKIRRMVVGGTRGLVVYDDLDQSEKLRVYQRGEASALQMRVNYRSGPITVPVIAAHEPLERVVSHFIHCIETAATPLTNAASALRVLSVVEAAESLMAQDAAGMGASARPRA